MFLEELPPELVEPLGAPPPSVVLPQVTGVISQAVQNLRDGRSGFVFVHEHTQDGSLNQTNAVFIKRVGEDIVATAWIGREWNKPGTVAWGASLVWEF